MKTTLGSVVLVAWMCQAAAGLEITFFGHWRDDASPKYAERDILMPKAMTDAIELTIEFGDYWLSREFSNGTSWDAIIDRIHGRTYGNDGGWLEWSDWRPMGGLQDNSPDRYDVRLNIINGTIHTNLTRGSVRQRIYTADGTLDRTEITDIRFTVNPSDNEPDQVGGKKLFGVPTIVANPTHTGTIIGHAGYLDGNKIGWMLLDSVRVVHDLLEGDANVDSIFDQLDIVQVLSAGRYMTGQRAAWSQGDWTADGLFDQRDLVAAQQASIYGSGPQAAVVAVPEPNGTAWLAAVAVAFLLSGAICGWSRPVCKMDRNYSLVLSALGLFVLAGAFLLHLYLSFLVF